LMSAIRMDGLCEPYLRRRAYRHLEKGRVCILACGTGRPFVTTDTAAALYACELGCEVLLKATRVDGVYNADPERNPHAVRYDHLSFQDVFAKGLNVMDMTAIGLCMDNKIPIMVFNYLQEGNLARAVAGEHVGTIVGAKP
jgi:uridylate kinase